MSMSRLAKRFREYLNLPPHLDLRADDTVDILGFLAFEMVRSLCVGGLEVKRSHEESASNPHPQRQIAHSPTKRKGGDDSGSKSKRRKLEEDEEEPVHK